MPHKFPGALALSMALVLALPQTAHACACGCGVFQVGTNNLLPTTLGNGTLLFAQVDYLDQSRDWSGSSSAPVADNADKNIRTLFQSIGVQTMVNRDWGLRVEVPYWQRHFTTLDAAGTPVSYDHGALGDIRVMGMYTGFSPDRSSGLMFGLKLATGDWTYPNFDRDTEIGTGTTDLLLGGYHQWKFGAEGGWGGFVQILADLPANSRAGYRPGNELDTSVGVYPQGWALGSDMRLTPMLQALVSLRQHDRGINADPANSGYQRVLFSPGFELAWQRLRVDVALAAPVYQYVKGYQLVAPWQASVNVSYAL
ncbi:lipoprotein [mine drainage metagenome]|uniref:Lipoprotein n=3 Tax=mine drainage metagenome TaxID=410659 RepID=T1B4F7_9ZZZZ